ncbi:hypothetical protein D9M69_683470 [compost metagenome]
MPNQPPISGRNKTTAMPRIAVNEMAAATSSPSAPMAGATAAIAELPQMALPQAISIAIRFGRPSKRAMR